MPKSKWSSYLSASVSAAFDSFSRLGVLGADNKIHALAHKGDDFSMMQIGGIMDSHQDLRTQGLNALIDNGGAVANEVAVDFIVKNPVYYGVLSDRARFGVTEALAKIAEETTEGLIERVQKDEVTPSQLFSIYENVHLLHERNAISFDLYSKGRNTVLTTMARGPAPEAPPVVINDNI